MMWEELGVTGMLSHIGWAFSTRNEAARQSSPAASCDMDDVPSLGSIPEWGQQPVWVPGTCSHLPSPLGPNHSLGPLHHPRMTLRAASPESPFPRKTIPKFVSLELGRSTMKGAGR